MAFDPALSAKYGLRAFQGDTLGLDLDEWSQAFASDIEATFVAYKALTAAARGSQTPYDGLLVRETDTGKVFLGTGTGWIQLGGPRTMHQAHSFTTNDITIPDPGVTIPGSFFVDPAGAETITIVSAIIHCVSVGSTPSVFKVGTDHGAHGTLADVAGLTALQPSTTQAKIVPTGGAFTLASLDRVCVRVVTAGNSVGCTITVITEHTA